ncbi:MAG: type II toxin-antitoxin system prevent-host-death family antitoxin [Acidobacteria bacterium]|nr:type II toxin-antitoxin system prevent-host-death family antitoxin [Acidobacteriota bacterium]
MTTVGVRVLKNRLSEYLRIAQSGERVTVTSRGAPVADIVPHAPRGLDPDGELLRLARAGEVRLGRPNAAVDYARPPREERWPHEEVMALLDWGRGDR